MLGMSALDLLEIDLADKQRPLPKRIGPFQINGRLGSGGMGVVLDATTESGQRVALKLMRPQGDRETREMLAIRLVREAQILQRMQHPGIVRLIDTGTIEDMVYIAMDCIEGVSLQDIRRVGPVRDARVVISLAIQLADVLATLHAAGIIHRDIKPGNVLIDQSGRAILTDFGIARMEESTSITRSGQVLGSPGYVAPEILEGMDTTPACDQFALGKLLFEIAALRPPDKIARGTPIIVQFAMRLEADWKRFPLDPPWPSLASIIRRMIARDPKERFPHMGACTLAFDELADVVDELASEERTSGRQTLPPIAQQPMTHPAIDNPTVFAQANTLNRFIHALAIEPHSPWASAPEGESRFDADAEPAPIIEHRPEEPPGFLEPNESSLSIDVRIVEDTEASKLSPSRERPLRSHIAIWVLAGLLGGAAVGEAFTATHATPSYRFAGAQAPDPRNVRVAQSMADAAKEQLAEDKLEPAVQLLGACIEIADLPECHRVLAGVLLVAGEPAGRFHLERYLAPVSP
jgi:serine/threonine protein kinase